MLEEGRVSKFGPPDKLAEEIDSKIDLEEEEEEEEEAYYSGEDVEEADEKTVSKVTIFIYLKGLFTPCDFCYAVMHSAK